MNEKILVIDDTQFNLGVLKDILEKENFTVFTLNNSLSALATARIVRPDVILLDIVMPDMDGFEVCRIIKNEPTLRDTPIIMESAQTEGGSVKKALELGAFDYIKKPIDEIEVIARIQSALRYKALQDELKELATKDGLTGLYNYSLLIELFEKELAKQKRTKDDISFVMVDIDFFKKVNDTFGHTAGNVILKKLADILTSSVRNGDIVARYGGEEFCIVLPKTNLKDAFEICERIRKKIECSHFLVGNNIINVTVSMGISLKSFNNSYNVIEIMKKADTNLYTAKNKGRNKVEAI
ncbi:MAG: diguanylate cyclase [Solirubrobacterales bacterium]